MRMSDEKQGTASRDKRVYFFNLDLAEGDAGTLTEAVQSFPSSVAQHLGVDVRVEKLPSDLEREVSVEIGKEADCIYTLLNGVYDWRKRRMHPDACCADDILCVFCSPGSAPARLAIKAEETACWGFEWDSIVFVYHSGDSGVTVWHELLHALGAVDCYEPKDHTCNRPDDCIMQYGRSRNELGHWPFLCDHNIRRIRDTGRDAT